MTPLLFWKIVGCGILGFFVLGIVLSILSAIAAILTPIIVPLLFLSFFALSILTYPLTLLLRACGYQSKSLFSFGCEKYEAWKENKERAEYRPNSQQTSNKTYDERHSSEHAQSKASPNDQLQKPSPWEVLGLHKGATKEEIGSAYRHKMMINHPDKVATLDPELQLYATKRTILIKSAYEELINT